MDQQLQLSLLFLIIATNLLTPTICLDFRLSTSKVLLPYYSFVPINFTLAAESDLKYCYQWTSTSPEVATVTPTNEECSQTAVITATWKNSYRASTAILVENLMTGHTIKCDVIVDKPSKLEIETTTQELYLHDAPEALVVRAFDDLGNIFSSLTGLPFEWTIRSAHGGDGLNILRFITWTESEYEIPAIIGNLESQGLQGDQQLVSGIKTGSAYVDAAVKDTIYSGVSQGRVRLLVMANAILKPGLAYLIPKTSLDFQVLVFHQGNLNQIPMPSPQYYLRLNDETKASLDIKNSRLDAKALGEVEVSLFDRNIEENETFKRPKSMISIVEASYLTFTAFPGRRWVLDTTRVYTLVIDIFDHNSHKIWLSDDLRLDAALPSEHFKVLESSRNGTWHLVKPIKVGSCVINGKLERIQTPDGAIHRLANPVTGSQEVEIYDPVEVLPESVTLPWSPGGNRSTCRLEASGGSGDYGWVSANASRVVVSSKGSITGLSVGVANVTAADVRNPDNLAKCVVRVSEPTGVAFLPAPVEAEIGQTLRLPIALYAGESAMCSCGHVGFEFEFEDSAVFQLVSHPNQTESGGSCRDCGELGCASVVVRAMRKGFTRLLAKYSRGDLSIAADVVLGAFKPLRSLADNFVVSLGSQESLSFRGGPQPWVLDPSSYRAQLLAPESPDLVQIEAKRDRHTSKTSFYVRCVKLGEQKLHIQTGNAATSKNRFPAKRLAKVTFVCATPTSLRLLPLLNLPKMTLPPCPVLSEEANRLIPVHNYRPVQVRVIVLDAEGRQFTNLASVQVDIASSDVDTAAASLSDENAALPRVTVQPKHRNSTVQVSVTLQGYKSSHSRHLSERPAKLSGVSGSVQFHTVPDATAQPHELVTYHKQAKALAYLADGSGHFVAERPSSSDVSPRVQGRYLSASSEREEEALVTVHDLCMERPQALTVPVLVVALRSLRLLAEDKMLLGSSESATLHYLAKGERIIPAELTAHLQLKIRVVPDGVVATGVGQDGSLTLSAESVGTARLQAECGGVRSNWAQVSVFPPLRLRPPNVTLLVGSLVQLQAIGGPQPAALRYSPIGSASSARVSESGLVEAVKVGRLRLRAESIGLDSSGNSRVFSSAEGWVSVVPLSDLRVHAPVTTVKAGNCLPLWAVANAGVGPIALATVTPPLYFYWSVDGEGQVAQLSHLLSPLGIPLKPMRAAAGVRLCGLSAGLAIVRLRASPGVSGGHSAQLSVRVVAALRLPGVCSECIRMATGSSYDLGVSADSAPVSYSLTDAKAEVVSVSHSGQLTAHSSYGGAFVTVNSLGQHAFNQTLTLKIEVCPIAYVMLEYSGPKLPQMRADLPHLPAGGLYKLMVRAYAALGDPIHAAALPLQPFVSRLDYLQLSDIANHSFALRATATGFTAFQVGHNGLEDFAVVFSAPAITPHDVQLPVGSLICFASPFAGRGIRWSSSDALVLNVSSADGVATAGSPGKAVVTLSAGDEPFTAVTEVTVTEVEALVASVPEGVVLSDSEQQPIAHVLVATAPQSTAILGDNCSLAESAVANLLTCEAKLVAEDGGQVGGVDGDAALTAKPTLLRGGLACAVGVESGVAWNRRDLAVLVTARLPRLSSSPVRLQFVPAVRIIGDSTVSLKSDSTAFVRLLSAPASDLVVQSSRPDLLEVGQPRESQDSSGVTEFSVRLAESAIGQSLPSDLKVTLRHKRIRQSLELPVRTEASTFESSRQPEREAGSFLSASVKDSLIYLVLGAIITVVVVLLTARFLQPQQQQQARKSSDHSPHEPLSDYSRQNLDRSGPVLWSQGYGYTSSADFSPVSPFRRSPNASAGMRSVIN